VSEDHIVKHTRLGRTGLAVSRLCLGAMSFGSPSRGNHEWTLDEDASMPLLRRAYELGITFWDTANAYSDGHSEEIVGRAMKDLATSREEIVLATKVFMPITGTPGGLSRKAILTAIDASLKRLGTDYVDLYQIHRWDPHTPIEETMEALHDVVKAGKARYLGASSMWAWQFSKAQYLAPTRFVSMQDHYNLLNREEEREMLPLCADQGVGVLPWSPLARGRLTRPWESTTSRSESDTFGKTLYGQAQYEESDRDIVAALAKVAAGRGVPMAQVAMAWLLSKPVITSPIVGATKVAHLEDAVAALDLELSADEIASLEAAYTPRPVAGFA
jgi:aryl-alcohol dehydrogenase-like predicted oxidoreductase